MAKTFIHRAGEDLLVYAAPKAFGRTLLRSDVSAISWTISLHSDPDTPLWTQAYYTAAEPSTGDLTQAMFDSLQSGSESAIDYTLLIVHDEGDFALDPSKVYLAEIALTVAISSPTYPDLADGGVKKIQLVIDSRRVA